MNYTAQRLTSLGYDSFAEETRKGYTGYEKDGESGLDFAQARYYNAVHGRFTSVDRLTASASIRNPQTFNRYSYVLNSPYKYVDPLGLLSVDTGACGGWCPNSGPSVDGSSFRGRDATFDHLKTISEVVAGFMSWLRARTLALNEADRAARSGAQLQSRSSRSMDRFSGPFVVPKDIVDGLINGDYPVQGNGSCAVLPQILLEGQMGMTIDWVAVQAVHDFENGPPRGTVIATFDANFSYPGAPTGNHVAIFLNFVRTQDGKFGMKVINQWKGIDKIRVSTYYFPSPNTPLPDVPSAAAIKDPRTYWVVYRRVRE